MGDLGLTPGLGRSPGEGKGYPLQYSGLENSMDCIVHGIRKSQTRPSNFHFPFRHWLYFSVSEAVWLTSLWIDLLGRVLSLFLLLLLIYFWLCWVFGAACWLSLVAVIGATLHCGTRASHCGPPWRRAQAVGVPASRAAARGLGSCGSQTVASGLGACGAWALLLCGLWNLPEPGIWPVSPTLAGGFLSTVSPRKS